MDSTILSPTQCVMQISKLISLKLSGSNFIPVMTAVLVYYLFVALKRCFHRRRAHVSPHRLINHCVILPFSVFWIYIYKKSRYKNKNKKPKRTKEQNHKKKKKTVTHVANEWGGGGGGGQKFDKWHIFIIAFLIATLTAFSFGNTETSWRLHQNPTNKWAKWVAPIRVWRYYRVK